jgi:hypothetical protein
MNDVDLLFDVYGRSIIAKMERSQEARSAQISFQRIVFLLQLGNLAKSNTIFVIDTFFLRKMPKLIVLQTFQIRIDFGNLEVVCGNLAVAFFDRIFVPLLAMLQRIYKYFEKGTFLRVDRTPY